jgi:hypothetical protein
VFGLVLIGVGVATLLSARGKKDDDIIMMSTTKGISPFPFPVEFFFVHMSYRNPAGNFKRLETKNFLKIIKYLGYL